MRRVENERRFAPCGFCSFRHGVPEALAVFGVKDEDGIALQNGLRNEQVHQNAFPGLGGADDHRAAFERFFRRDEVCFRVAHAVNNGKTDRRGIFSGAAG